MAVKSYTMQFSFMLLFSLVQPTLLNNVPQCSMEIRDQNIDALWYKSRGIRPVGRFERRMVKTGGGESNYGKKKKKRLCSPCCVL
uniref:Prolactin releasing hormone n=1 Tax=Pygocentrus nattereri TaxID=42514 RepID=A0A3B4DJS5_PYGNA